MVCLFFINLVSIIYIGLAESLEGRDLNRMERTNETIISFIAYLTVGFTDFG